MPFVKFKIRTLEFKHAKYSKSVKRIIAIQFRESARAFLRAAIPLVPVETGMARGSFLNIAKFLRVSLVINPTKTKQMYYGAGGGGPLMQKNKESGASLSTFSIPGKSGKKKLEFKFNSAVWHYQLEDRIGVRSPSAPWNSIAIGMVAFNQKMSGLLTRPDFPKIKDFITTTEVG